MATSAARCCARLRRPGERTAPRGDTVRAHLNCREDVLTIDEAIRDLLDVSTDITSVVVVDAHGDVVAAGPGAAGTDVSAAIERLWDAASRRASQLGEAGLKHLVVPVAGGTVAVVAAHGRRAAAVAGPRPAVALLLFDLRTCLDDAFAAEEGRR